MTGFSLFNEILRKQHILAEKKLLFRIVVFTKSYKTILIHVYIIKYHIICNLFKALSNYIRLLTTSG